MTLRDRLMRFFALKFRARSQRRHRDDVAATLSAARSTMRRKTYCVLATMGNEGIDARVLQPWAPSENLEVWFGTSPSSTKVAQLRANSQATVVYENDAKAACVTLLGTIEIVDDLEQRRAHFKPTWWAFFPEGPTGDDFVALRFTPQSLSVWDASRAITPPPFGLASSKLVRRDGQWSRA